MGASDNSQNQSLRVLTPCADLTALWGLVGNHSKICLYCMKSTLRSILAFSIVSIKGFNGNQQYFWPVCIGNWLIELDM